MINSMDFKATNEVSISPAAELPINYQAKVNPFNDYLAYGNPQNYDQG
jgi:hypothetical protein